LPYGRIVFEPIGASGNTGPQAYAVIENGRYSTSSTGLGSIGGAHEVIITGFDGVLVNDDAPFGGPLFPAHRETHNLPWEELTIDFQIPSS